MRNAIYGGLAILISMSYSPDASAQGFICDQCRGPFLHYKDYGNFVFNAFHGTKPWLGPFVKDAPNHTNPVQVVNSKGQMVEVLVPYAGNPFAWPDNVVEIMVIKPNGVVERYEISASRIGQDVPIGRSNGPGGGPSGPGGPGNRGRSGPGYQSGPTFGPQRQGRCGTSEVDGDSGTRRRTCN